MRPSAARAPRAPVLAGALVLSISFLAMAFAARAQEAVFTEAAVKAAFLYHFGTYVNWPDADAPDAALSITVLGDAEVFDALDRYLSEAERTIDGRPVVARLVRSTAELGDDEILYIGPEENWRLDTIVSAASRQGRLIVTDVPSGIGSGTAINFRLVDDRVRFEIDRDAAAAAGLSFNARLLAAALTVFGGA